MLAAMAIAATVYASPGTTYSGIAAQYGVSVSAVEADNSYPATDIPIGAAINVPGGSSSTSSPSSSSESPSSGSGGGGGSAGSSSSSSGGYHIPGVSDAVASCIASKESANGQASSNVFQLQSGYYPGESLAQQEQAAGQLAASQGVHSAWGVYDGCA